MKKLAALSAVLCALALSACDVEQTREAKAPDVDVDVKGGQAPAYDVDAPDVDVNKEQRTVEVPNVDVNTEKRTITVPDVDVKPADADGDGR